ncbi:hypothetical protein Tco_0510667 [Tanacetum coccineum]
MDEVLKKVLMIDELSIVKTDKVNHTVETDMMKLVVEIKCFGVNFDEFDKETDELQPKQADLNCVHALNEPHLHEIHVEEGILRDQVGNVCGWIMGQIRELIAFP